MQKDREKRGETKEGKGAAPRCENLYNTEEDGWEDIDRNIKIRALLERGN